LAARSAKPKSVAFVEIRQREAEHVEIILRSGRRADFGAARQEALLGPGEHEASAIAHPRPFHQRTRHVSFRGARWRGLGPPRALEHARELRLPTR
jgi:hypothetical protein